MSDERHLDDTSTTRRSLSVNRRGLLRLAAVGAGASALTGLLAACGGTESTATSAPVPTATKAAASAAPSSAPAASAAASAAPAR